MSDAGRSADDQRSLASVLQSRGAIVALSSSGRLLRVDFRPIASQIDDEFVLELAGSTRLKELYLARSKITSACVACLCSLERLSVLDLQNTALDDASIEQLARLPDLSMLIVRGTLTTQDCIKNLRRRLTKVRIVS